MNPGVISSILDLIPCAHSVCPCSIRALKLVHLLPRHISLFVKPVLSLCLHVSCMPWAITIRENRTGKTTVPTYSSTTTISSVNSSWPVRAFPRSRDFVATQFRQAGTWAWWCSIPSWTIAMTCGRSVEASNWGQSCRNLVDLARVWSHDDCDANVVTRSGDWGGHLVLKHLVGGGYVTMVETATQSLSREKDAAKNGTWS